MPDTTRPRGALFGPINFAAPTTNPYGLDVGFYASPSHQAPHPHWLLTPPAPSLPAPPSMATNWC